MPEYRKEWFQKAQIDYFAPFVNLWLSCNAWYMDHYAEISGRDRDHINIVKSDNTSRNHVFKQFKKRMESSDKNALAFRSNLEQLHFALQNACLESDTIGLISFEAAVCDYNNKAHVTNLLIHPRIKSDGTIYEADKDLAIKLENVYVTSDLSELFAGVFEIIYQVRNNLIHGHMSPGDNEYEVVKYCYFVLYDLMSF